MKDWEDYEDESFEERRENRSKKPKKQKNKHGNRGLSQEWLNEQQDDDPQQSEAPNFGHPFRQEPKQYQPMAPAAAGTAQQPHYAHRFSANTLALHGVQIDFDGVDSLLPIQKYYNGSLTYGLKFIFSGNNGFYKIIWYGADLASRDADAKTASDRLTQTKGAKSQRGN